MFRRRKISLLRCFPLKGKFLLELAAFSGLRCLSNYTAKYLLAKPNHNNKVKEKHNFLRLENMNISKLSLNKRWWGFGGGDGGEKLFK